MSSDCRLFAERKFNLILVLKQLLISYATYPVSCQSLWHVDTAVILPQNSEKKEKGLGALPYVRL